MGYVRYILVALLCSYTGALVDGALFEGNVCAITFFFIPAIYLLYKIFVILDNNINVNREEEKVTVYGQDEE